jgi:hypothetical protein
MKQGFTSASSAAARQVPRFEAGDPVTPADIAANPKWQEMFNKNFHKYLDKNIAFIQQEWNDILAKRVYSNTPLCYLPTHALTKGFNARQFIQSMNIRLDMHGFNLDLDFTFDQAGNGNTGGDSPVMLAHRQVREASGDIFQTQVTVRYGKGRKKEVNMNLPTFMRSYYKRYYRQGSPLYTNAELMQKLNFRGSFYLPESDSESYFADYFIAGPNAPSNPKVYKMGGHNPPGTTRVSDRYLIILDFLTRLGLIPSDRNRPGSGDWIIEISQFAPDVYFHHERSHAKIGGFLYAAYQMYQDLLQGKKITRTYRYKAVNKEVAEERESFAKGLWRKSVFRRNQLEQSSGLRRRLRQQGLAGSVVELEQNLELQEALDKSFGRAFNHDDDDFEAAEALRMASATRSGGEGPSIWAALEVGVSDDGDEINVNRMGVRGPDKVYAHILDTSSGDTETGDRGHDIISGEGIDTRADVMQNYMIELFMKASEGAVELPPDKGKKMKAYLEAIGGGGMRVEEIDGHWMVILE